MGLERHPEQHNSRGGYLQVQSYGVNFILSTAKTRPRTDVHRVAALLSVTGLLNPEMSPTFQVKIIFLSIWILIISLKIKLKFLGQESTDMP